MNYRTINSLLLLLVIAPTPRSPHRERGRE